LKNLIKIQGRLTVTGTKEDLETLYGVIQYDDAVSSAVSDLVADLQMMFDTSERCKQFTPERDSPYPLCDSNGCCKASECQLSAHYEPTSDSPAAGGMQ